MMRATRGSRPVPALRPFTPARPAAPAPAVPGDGARVPFGVADELSCYYDAPAEPCTVHVELRVPGPLDQARLSQAIGAALAAQPRARVRRARGGWWQRGYTWELTTAPDTDPLTAAAWADEAALGRLRADFLSVTPTLATSPPLRILLATGPAESRVILSAHHAALDGLSCLELLRSISGLYATSPGAPPHPAGGTRLPAAAPAGPAPVVTAPPPAATTLTAPPDPGADLGPAAGLGLLPKPCTRIAADRGEDPAPGDGSGYGFVLLPGQPVTAVRHAARQHGVTVNDLLIAALVVTVSRWNAGHGAAAGRIRITMPVNSRRDDEAGSAGNLSRLTAVTAPGPGAGQDLGPLLADVAGQTRAAKDRVGPQVDPLSRALAIVWCPPAVKRRLIRLALRTAGPLLCDTSLVSNLGIVADPPRFGDMAATGMWFSTSAHMPRGLSVGAITVGGRLHLCFRYRRALFSDAAAGRFAGTYAAALSDITDPGRQP